MNPVRSLLVMFLLPILIPALATLLIGYWSFHVLQEHQEQNRSMLSNDSAQLTNILTLLNDISSLQQRSTKALEGAASRTVSEEDIYRIHTQLVNEFPFVKKRAHSLVDSEKTGDGDLPNLRTLPDLVNEYGSFIIVATEVAYVDPAESRKYLVKARQKFIEFTEETQFISTSLSNRLVQRSDKLSREFDVFIKQVLILSFAGIFSMILLALLSARKISLRIIDMAEALSILSRNKESPPLLPKIERMYISTRDKFSEMAHAILVFRDLLIEHKNVQDKAYKLAFFDELTHLPNRRLLLNRLDAALFVSERSKKFGAVLFLDMDNFKTVNDTLGHEFGDLLLIEVSARLESYLRKVDTVSRLEKDDFIVARLGGDEFIVLLEEVDNHVDIASQKVALVAERIRVALSEPYKLKESTLYSSPSIGVCLYLGTEQSVDVLLKSADIAMYHAKDAGRNTVRFFDPAMQQTVETHAALEADLRHAVPEQQLHLYYQIQMDSDRRPIGAEALIRWIHPTRGMVSPMQFIPIAEESGLIIDIGDWVLETACQQLKAWAKDEHTQSLLIAVNVSAQQFKQPDFVDKIAAVLRTHRIDPSRLKLELTESVVLDDVKAVVSKMHELKAIGIKLSMDDFGTGYSSLSYLKQLPLDQLKIDMSFVRDMLTDPNDAVMVKTIIDLAHNFRLNVIAEGVETEAQMNLLKQMDCLSYQGYYFSKPVPIAQLEALLKKG